MALIWSQDFSADASPDWEQEAHFRVSTWRTSGSATADSDYPEVMLTENIKVDVGVGPNGENAIDVFTPASTGVEAIEFAGMGTLGGGEIDTSKVIRYVVDTKLTTAPLDLGYMTLQSIYGYNVSAPNASPSVLVELYELSGDSWQIEITVERWNSADYNATAAVSRAAIEGLWHTFEVQFKHCTVNDYATDDVESDGFCRLLWNDVEIFSVEDTDTTLVLFTAARVNYFKAASLAWAFYGPIGPTTNFAYYDSLTDPVVGSLAGGVNTTGTGDLSVSIGLDGDTHQNDDPRSMKVWADKFLFDGDFVAGVHDADPAEAGSPVASPPPSNRFWVVKDTTVSPPVAALKVLIDGVVLTIAEVEIP